MYVCSYYGIRDSCNIRYAPLSCEINTIIINYIAQYLTIIPRARIGPGSIYNIDSEAMRARGIIVLVKSK